jgi:hypothetical protein
MVWIQDDPEGYVDGMNIYEPLASNPISNVDPDGLAAQPGMPPGWRTGGVWSNNGGVIKDPKGSIWTWHDPDVEDQPGRWHKPHWDVVDKNGDKTRRDPKTGEDMGDAIDHARNGAYNPKSCGCGMVGCPNCPDPKCIAKPFLIPPPVIPPPGGLLDNIIDSLHDFLRPIKPSPAPAPPPDDRPYAPNFVG